MFEQLEMCQAGNYLPVTESSGRELRPLQGENRGHIFFFFSLFISFPLSGSFSVVPLPELPVFSHCFSVHISFFFWLAVVEEPFFALLSYIALFSSVLSCLNSILFILNCFQWVTVRRYKKLLSEWRKENKRKLGQHVTIRNRTTSLSLEQWRRLRQMHTSVHTDTHKFFFFFTPMWILSFMF